MDEFAYIESCLSTLSTNGALKNDAFLYQQNTVITKDIIIEGVHFLPRTKPSDIAKKALRVNLSDLAAMGAKPYGYFLGLVLNNTSSNWLNSLTGGLREDSKKYNLKLLGGDTTAHQGATMISITMLGLVDGGNVLTRSNAQINDRVYVSNTIGDAALGLLTYTAPSLQSFTNLQENYKYPDPQLELGQYLLSTEQASACLDISDGLIQDANHICCESKVGMVIDVNKIPFSSTAKKIIGLNHKYLEIAITGGDDYQLLFTSPYDIERDDITEIGTVTKGDGVVIQNAEMSLNNQGYKHFR